ncbi:MAG: Glucuronoxylanase XynC precursor [bacterium ADurb.Bin429]|nr:MAG: Glucuronoxylanase XynC precursor [bacterium ADurb.Bin429]
MPRTRWISTTPTAQWREQTVDVSAPVEGAALALDGTRHQTWDGWGGCFNELGWIALSGLDADARYETLGLLFDQRDGCKFTFCRMPIGASDYGAEWYSLNETAGDFAMTHFSIARDKGCLIPYIKAAMAWQPELALFASPWSPPTWFKFPRAYNYGTMIWQPEYLDAYARYFLKFVQAYRAEGINITQVHVQNEPVADQKFPSCLWTGAQMRDFIRDHLGPLFAREGLDCEIWLGTLNTDDYDGYPHTVMSDPDAYRYTAGVGFQWAGKGAIQRTHESWPEKRLMQTENECGDGRNTWEYARYVYDLFRHYITNGANAYVYWNMILQPGGLSTWGWRQNAMITVDPAAKTVTLNPEFYVMKHFSSIIAPGATRLGLKGPWTGNAVAFANPDGGTAMVVGNPFADDRALTFDGAGTRFTVTLPGYSFNTFVIEG